MSADAHYCSATAHFLQPSITKKHKKPLICFLQTVRKAILPVLYGFGFGFFVVGFFFGVFLVKAQKYVFIASEKHTQRKGRNVLVEWLSHCDL